MEEKPYNKDRQKKTLSHNKAGRKFGGGTEGLAGLPQAAAEVPEGYISGWQLSTKKYGA